MERADRLIIVGLGVLAGTFSIARLRALESLSPPDLAFFHQATWSAARGDGFVQTALEFDAGTLFGSIHLSLIRAVWVPIYAMLPAVETLVALQGVCVVAASATAAAACVSEQRDRPLVALLVGLSPLALALGACDLRPITFLVAPAMLAVAGVWRERSGWVMAGVLGALLAREEAWMVCAALVPFAAVRGYSKRRWRDLVVVLLGVAAGLAMPRVVWGHGGNISANAHLAGTWAALWDGSRPWLRWPVEQAFALRVLAAAWPAGLCPELLVPAVVGWAWLMVFSELEPAAPAHGGLHYLAVVAPLLLGAAVVGWERLAAVVANDRRWMWRGALLAPLLLAAPELLDGLDWTRQALRPGPLATQVDQLRSETGPVVVVSQAAPLLSGREVLRIQGHFSPTPDRIRGVASEVDHAVLPAERPADGPPAAEWDAWQKALPAAGLGVQATVEGQSVWGRER